MKESKYNFFINDSNDDIYLIYNALKNTLISDNDCRVQRFIKQSKGDIVFNPECITHEEYLELISSGVIVSNETDEKQVAIDINQRRLDILQKEKDFLYLVITPTLQCNFQCYYCFESTNIRKDTNSMGLEVQNDIIDFVTKSITENHIKKVAITWYGGEPLIQLPIIISMQKKINEICQLYDIKANSSSMITNGILLSDESVDLLYESGIREIQVTIDGPEHVHNRRRYYPADPTNNYNSIMRSIVNSIERIRYAIRVNIDNSNKNLIFALIDNLIERGIWPHKNVHLRMAYVNSDCNKGFSISEFTILHDKIRVYLMDKYNEIKQTNEAKLDFLYPKYGGKAVCGYGTSKNSWVISYNGDVFRCWEAVGIKEHSVCTIKNLLEDFGRSVFEKIKLGNAICERWGCFDCKYFPICGLTCPWDFIDEGRRCTEWKSILEYKILNQYKQFLKNPEIFNKVPFKVGA